MSYLEMIHVDAEQAFIQADIDAEVYVRLPLGCGALTNTIVRLNRALFGCKQSSRAWNIHLTSTLKSFGFDRSMADHCLLRFLDGNENTLLIATHVDDMIAVGSRQNCDALCKALSIEFPTNNLGPLSWYTGCAFKRNWESGTRNISQTAYIDQLCERFDVSFPSSLLAAPHQSILPRQEDEPQGSEKYRELIGSLLWLANMTRPDISNAV
ncbi:unnamed protein product, partial [Discosporangium mesarthrocarpum]